MVIVVEEQKNGASILSIVTWLTIIGILGAATYYIFFKQPDIIQFAAPANLGATQQIAKINLDANSILNNPSFKSLKTYIALPKAGNAGRQNPFLSIGTTTIVILTSTPETATTTASAPPSLDQ